MAISFTNTPPEMAADIERLERQKRVQEAILAKTLSPKRTEQVSGRVVPYSPLEGITQLMSAYMGREAGKKTNQGIADLGTTYNENRSKAVVDVLSQFKGQKGGMDTGVPLREIEPDPMGAAISAAGNPYLEGTSDVITSMMKAKMGSSGVRPFIKPVDMTVDGETGTYMVNHRTGEILKPDMPTMPSAVSGASPSVVNPRWHNPTLESSEHAKKAGSQQAILETKPAIESDTQASKSQQAMSDPTSIEYRKERNLHADDFHAYNTIMGTKGDVINKLDYILDENRTSAFNSQYGGYNAYATRLTPGDDVANMRAKINSLKAAMKSAGKELMTSGGTSIGTITEREWPILEQQIDDISPTLGEEGARAVFSDVRNKISDIQMREGEKYEVRWGGTPFYKGGNPKNAPASNINIQSVPKGWDIKDYKFLSKEEMLEAHEDARK